MPLLLFLLLAACAHVQQIDNDTAVADRLFCGRSRVDGAAVTDEEIETFLREVVEVRYPRGFTVWHARGAWNGGREDVLVLEIVHPAGAEHERMMREIAESYRQRFRQESVLRVTTPATMEFVP